MIIAYRSLVTAGKIGMEDKTPTHISGVERMTKGGDIGNQSKCGEVLDRSSPGSHWSPIASRWGLPVKIVFLWRATINDDGTDGQSSSIDRFGFRQRSQD